MKQLTEKEIIIAQNFDEIRDRGSKRVLRIIDGVFENKDLTPKQRRAIVKKAFESNQSKWRRNFRIWLKWLKSGCPTIK